MIGTQKIKKEIKVAGKVVRRVIGVKTDVEVFKSSIWKPLRIAPLTILFDYGIDDIRQNLQYVKDFTKHTSYVVGNRILSRSMDDAIEIVESEGLEKKLQKQVITVWKGIERKFDRNRKRKRR